MAWSPSGAVALAITFDDAASGGNPLSVLDTHGYRFARPFRTIGVMALTRRRGHGTSRHR